MLELARCAATFPAVMLAISVLLALPAVAISDAGVANPAPEARRLQGEYKRVKTLRERQEIAAALLGLGPDGGRRLHAIARGEFLKRLPTYSAAFQRTAADVLRRRAPAGDPTAEIAALRHTIHDVSKAAELTKELIEQKSDPALARLESLLAVTPADVLAADATLVASREELLVLAGWAEQAGSLVPEKERGKLPPLPGLAQAVGHLDAADELAAVLATPLSPADRQTLIANVPLARNLDPEEARGIQRLNQIRVLVGLPAQAIDPGLVAACRMHSEDMCTKDFFAHESPIAGRETPWKRAAIAGTTGSAENIAAGTQSGPEAVLMWWHSPGHHKNMLGDQKRTGLGRYERHWTQLFG